MAVAELRYPVLVQLLPRKLGSRTLLRTFPAGNFQFTRHYLKCKESLLIQLLTLTLTIT